ncbi:unnamed protein product [Cylicocyclus nassatus]|uniref:Uncharacterized protein n=1 Tax=Cylicocyclus nassatus TaxID=53992 RepID=A0AA36GV92_CYLNA|nr:unnamed protein product [Cylicocyclus nassatus]
MFRNINFLNLVSKSRKTLMVPFLRIQSYQCYNLISSIFSNIVTLCHLSNEAFEKRSLLLKLVTDSYAELQPPFKRAYCSKTACKHDNPNGSLARGF